MLVSGSILDEDDSLASNNCLLSPFKGTGFLWPYSSASVTSTFDGISSTPSSARSSYYWGGFTRTSSSGDRTIELKTVSDVHNLITRESLHMEESLYRHYVNSLAGSGKAPWEIHRPQRVVVDLAKRGAFPRYTRVLDVGCSIGDNALFIAGHTGAAVTGIDVEPKCLEFARTKTAMRHMQHAVTWLQGDILTATAGPAGLHGAGAGGGCLHGAGAGGGALHGGGGGGGGFLPGCGGGALRGVAPFDSVLALQMFDLFVGTDKWGPFMAALRAVTRAGGRLYVMACSDKFPGPGGFTRSSRRELQEAFCGAHGWRIESIEDVYAETHPALYGGKIESYLLTATRLTPAEEEEEAQLVQEILV